MKKITLISRYNGYELHLRVSQEAYNKLANCGGLSSADRITLINEDLDRVKYGVKPKLISEYQCRKINNFFAKGNTEYFDRVILDE